MRIGGEPFLRRRNSDHAESIAGSCPRVTCTHLLVGENGFDFETPFAFGWAAVIGAVTGFVGAFTAWLAQTGNLIGLSTLPGDRFGAAFGFIGATIGIVLWPLFGAAVCVIAALLSVRWRRAV